MPQPVQFSGPDENRNYNFLGQQIGQGLQTASKYIPELIQNRRKMKNNEASNAEDYQEMTSAIDRLTSNPEAMESMAVKGNFNSADEVVTYLRELGANSQPKDRETSEKYLERQLDIVKKINAMGADGFQEWLRDVSVGETDPSVIASMTKNGQRRTTANDVDRLSKQEGNTVAGLDEARSRNPDLSRDASFNNLYKGTVESTKNAKAEQDIATTRDIINSPATIKIISDLMDKFPRSPEKFRNAIQDEFKNEGITKIAMDEFEQEQIAVKAQKLLNNKQSPEALARTKGLKELEKMQKYFNKELNALKIKNKTEGGEEKPNSDLMTEQDFQMDAIKDSISVVKKAYGLVSSGKVKGVQDAKTSALGSLRGGFEARDEASFAEEIEGASRGALSFRADQSHDMMVNFAKKNSEYEYDGTNITDLDGNVLGKLVNNKWVPVEESTGDEFSNAQLTFEEPTQPVSDTIDRTVGTTTNVTDFSKYEN